MSNPNWGKMDPLLAYKLRVSEELGGRMVYLQRGEEPSEEDEFVGLMETADIARHLVKGHNERRARHGSIRPRFQ